MSAIPTFIKNQNLVTWLETEALKGGTANQRERWAAGVLPDDELCALAREVLFAPFANGRLVRWMKIRPRDLEHRAPGCQGEIIFTTGPCVDLRHGEWERYKQIEAVCQTANQHEWTVRSGEAFGLEKRFHVAECSGCGGKLALPTVIVRVSWAGRVLSREFAL